MQKRLGDIVRVRTGRTPSNPWQRKLYDHIDGVPFVRVKDIVESNGDLTSTEIKLPESVYSESVEAYKNSVLLSISGTIGATAVLKIDALFNQAIVALDELHNLLPEFLMFNLISKKADLLFWAYGTCQLNINQDVVKKLLIPILSVEEQMDTIKKIMAIDNAIRQKKEEIKKAEMLRATWIQKLFQQ